MKKIALSVDELIGNTPLLELKHIEEMYELPPRSKQRTRLDPSRIGLPAG